ncbi:hypothetical protein QFZ67_007758, partial [Streptomyces sp. V1I1]|nr:hypothetical protein [Streptomyces sp. V1I1]
MAIGVQSLFGESAAEGVVEVAPPAGGGLGVGEPVFGVPGEAPGKGLSREGVRLAEGEAAL